MSPATAFQFSPKVGPNPVRQSGLTTKLEQCLFSFLKANFPTPTHHLQARPAEHRLTPIRYRNRARDKHRNRPRLRIHNPNLRHSRRNIICRLRRHHAKRLIRENNFDCQIRGNRARLILQPTYRQALKRDIGQVWSWLLQSGSARNASRLSHFEDAATMSHHHSNKEYQFICSQPNI